MDVLVHFSWYGCNKLVFDNDLADKLKSWQSYLIAMLLALNAAAWPQKRRNELTTNSVPASWAVLRNSSMEVSSVTERRLILFQSYPSPSSVVWRWNRRGQIVMIQTGWTVISGADSLPMWAHNIQILTLNSALPCFEHWQQGLEPVQKAFLSVHSHRRYHHSKHFFDILKKIRVMKNL